MAVSDAVPLLDSSDEISRMVKRNHSELESEEWPEQLLASRRDFSIRAVSQRDDAQKGRRWREGAVGMERGGVDRE